ncbi:hypothetical protein [Sphingomonas lutea]|uniref:hypothetical protein n=1 Tax=Sphingomonas lutea TaxID=1045317 RepID=UPI003144E1FD
MPGKILLFVVLALTACRAQPEETPFPKAQRDVAPIVSDAFSTEDARDRVGRLKRCWRWPA